MVQIFLQKNSTNVKCPFYSVHSTRYSYKKARMRRPLSSRSIQSAKEISNIIHRTFERELKDCVVQHLPEKFPSVLYTKGHSAFP